MKTFQRCPDAMGILAAYAFKKYYASQEYYRDWTDDDYIRKGHHMCEGSSNRGEQFGYAPKEIKDELFALDGLIKQRLTLSREALYKVFVDLFQEMVATSIVPQTITYPAVLNYLNLPKTYAGIQLQNGDLFSIPSFHQSYVGRITCFSEEKYGRFCSAHIGIKRVGLNSIPTNPEEVLNQITFTEGD